MIEKTRESLRHIQESEELPSVMKDSRWKNIERGVEDVEGKLGAFRGDIDKIEAALKQFHVIGDLQRQHELDITGGLLQCEEDLRGAFRNFEEAVMTMRLVASQFQSYIEGSSRTAHREHAKASKYKQ